MATTVNTSGFNIAWDETGKRFYETGVSRGVLYVKGASTENTENKTGYGDAVAWNGLTAVTESPSGAEATALYADDIKYLSLMSTEEFGATIEAYTYPDEFAACDGSAELGTGVYIGQQARSGFSFCYTTREGNDEDGNDYNYKLHIIYNCLAAPSEKAYATINDSPEAITFSWEVTTTPVAVTGHKPTACVTIDAAKVTAAKMSQIEAKLFGTESTPGMLLMPDDIVTILGQTA